MRSFVSYVFLAILYTCVLTMARLFRRLRRRPCQPTGRIMVTGTFHNPNWYLSHIRPLAECGVREVILVVDAPQRSLPRVRFVCPPRWLACLTSRAVAKAIWTCVAGLRHRPDLYMGYHIIPGAVTALIAARALGRPACYQMTGGPAEIAGGGIEDESWLMSGLSRPSRFLERLAVSVVREFDLVVVRGRRARRFLRERGLDGNVAVITGSVRANSRNGCVQRRYDMIFVGRLAEIKQPEQFLRIAAAVGRRHPNATAAVVGDGPLLPAMKREAARLGIPDRIDFLGKRKDVEALLSEARTFVLTSRSEGLSISMAEGMAAGAVPVVADVGELGDLVIDGENGFLVRPNDVDQYVDRIVSLLDDQARWQEMSRAAVATAVGACGVERVAGLWRHHLASAMDQARAGCAREESK